MGRLLGLTVLVACMCSKQCAEEARHQRICRSSAVRRRAAAAPGAGLQVAWRWLVSKTTTCKAAWPTEALNAFCAHGWQRMLVIFCS